jgi:hypothetical protein
MEEVEVGNPGRVRVTGVQRAVVSSQRCGSLAFSKVPAHPIQNWTSAVPRPSSPSLPIEQQRC